MTTDRTTEIMLHARELAIADGNEWCIFSYPLNEETDSAAAETFGRYIEQAKRLITGDMSNPR